MSIFLRLLDKPEKAQYLPSACDNFRNARPDSCIFEVAPEDFSALPGKPFSYWVGNAVRNVFLKNRSFEFADRTARAGLCTGDDTRFVRLNWEVLGDSNKWRHFAKGGIFSPYYCDLHLRVRWDCKGHQIVSGAVSGTIPGARPQNIEFFGRSGITWPLRTTSGLSVRALPRDSVFGHKGPAAFQAEDKTEASLALLALCNSRSFNLLVSLQLAAADAAARSYEVGVFQKTPFPQQLGSNQQQLAVLSHRAWKLKRTLDTIEETSHAFSLPQELRVRLGNYDPPAIEAELSSIQAEIDNIAFDLYGFSEADRAAVHGNQGLSGVGAAEGSADDEGDDEDSAAPIDHTAGLLSWAVGVAFGRFDWRLATGERAAPTEPEPFDPLPAKSPGMLPDGAEPFHAHAGILVDDQGHPHDLARLVEEVLNRVDVSVPDEVRRWLRKDFFAFHLQRYSKSRRKAPIYWPLATASGSYTLWVYYPSLNNQTLFTAVNDFLDGPNGKLTQVSRECAELRIKGSSRSRDEEKQYETLQTFEQELTDLRDTLLKIAPTYQPNHDDGVQITAAPLWPLFRHKPWQKVLKDTWAKLEKGNYDWAHLTMAYWPERVREKCKTDKSLAIAHGLEDQYVEPEAAPKKARGRKKAGGEE